MSKLWIAPLLHSKVKSNLQFLKIKIIGDFFYALLRSLFSLYTASSCVRYWNGVYANSALWCTSFNSMLWLHEQLLLTLHNDFRWLEKNRIYSNKGSLNGNCCIFCRFIFCGWIKILLLFFVRILIYFLLSFFLLCWV